MLTKYILLMNFKGKNYIEDSYLYLNQKYKYFKYDKTDTLTETKTFVLATSRNM